MRVDLLWKMELSCIRMRNWVGEGLADFSFHVWVGGSVLQGTMKLCDPQSPSSASKIKIKISGSTEGVDCSNISIYGFYLLKVPILRRFWRLRLTQKDGKKFASGKIINLMTTDAQALQVFLPFALCVHNLLHNWLFTKPNSVRCWVSLFILPYILFYSLIFVMGGSIPGIKI